MFSQSQIPALQQRFDDKPAEEVLAFFIRELGRDLVLASSLGVEDQVLTHMLVQLDSKARVFVLDTGRLHQETYDILDESMRQFGIHYEVYFPDDKAVSEMVASKGANLFYKSVENRKQCCGVRKVEPLRRALSSCKGWVTGLRRAQSVTRATASTVEWDDTHGIVKINPLVAWSQDDVWAYVRKWNVPVNRLHDQGYPSIGCAPCTRAIQPGEDLRAGRWWWEQPESKECGLHVKLPGVRK